MKFAFCLFRYFPFGGLQRDFLRIAKECIKRGHQVDVYTMRWEGERDADLPVTLIPANGWQNHTRIKQFVQQVHQHLANGQYDLVVGFNKMPGLDVYYAADTCYQAKVRRQHGAWYRWLPRYQQLVAYEQAVFAKEARTEILLISNAQQAEFQMFYQTDSKRLHLLPPGIAKDRLAPSNAKEIRSKTRDALNIVADQFLLLFVGSGFKTKGLDRVLIGIAHLPETIKKRVALYVIGKDNPTRFQHQAKQLNIADHIHFLGGRSDVPLFLLAADLLVHPAYNENTGTVLLEAIASGLPVLTTDVCGYANYIKEAKAGIVLSSPFQQTEFNQAIAEMLTSPERKIWQQNGVSFAKKADIYSLAERAAEKIELFSPLGSQSFDKIMALRGEVYRELENRRTQRVVLHGKPYFVKQHFGVGWKEIFKNIFQLKLPIISAKNEWLALQQLAKLNIATLDIVSYGCRGINPAKLQSYLITRELPEHISLEELGKEWQKHPPVFHFKLKIMMEVARIVRTIHEHGINHRDCYICHFLLEKNTFRIYLIDLHRAQIRKQVPTRWKIKDLAGLYFSSKEIGLTKRDVLRFMKEYRKKPLRFILNKETAFWKKVKHRGDKLYQKSCRKSAVYTI